MASIGGNCLYARRTTGDGEEQSRRFERQVATRDAVLSVLVRLVQIVVLSTTVAEEKKSSLSVAGPI